MSVELGKVREFARALGAQDRRYVSDEQPPVPATFLIVGSFLWGYSVEEPGDTVFAHLDIDRKQLLHAEEEVEFVERVPVAGEKLLATPVIEKTYCKQGKSSSLQFTVVRTQFRSPDGILIAIQRCTFVSQRQGGR